MTSRECRSVMPRLGAIALLLALPPALVGCGEDPPEVVVVPPPPPPPPPPPAPKFTPIEQLMASLGIDPRVRLPEELAPDNDEARIAILKFMDAFVRGDATAVGTMLSGPDKAELERLQKDKRWTDAVASITRVDVRAGQNKDNQPVMLAVFHTGKTFQPQLWSYETSPAAEFIAEPTPPGIIDQLSGTDWIAAWYKVLDAEMRKADEPDETVLVKSVNLDKNKEDDLSAKQPDGLPIRRGGGVPGRRPVGEPIEPPGLKPTG